MAKTAKTEQEEPLEKKLWKAADKLRKNMDAAEYKHVALGLIFLKYISDAFEEQYQKLVAQKSEGADPEDKNEYVAEKVFFVPATARWSYIQGRATQPTIGKDIDDAMDAIEKDNPSLRGVLPKVFAQEKLDKTSLGGLVNLIGSATIGTKEAQNKDILGQVFEYFLGEFALAEGKKGGQFYTPQSVVKLLVEMLEPYEGRVFDPCCGSGGMFVQSEKFINKHQDYYKKKGKTGLSLNPADRISIYGQESNQTTWRLAKMNLSIRGIDSSNVKWNNEGSFLNDAHKDLKADYIIANPPFNDSDWSGELLRDDARWKVLGEKLTPPTGNANYAWIQHFLYHLAPTGQAGFVLANTSLSSDIGNEGDIRKNIIEENLVDCIVDLPAQLFFNTQITACLWFLSRNRKRNDVLFINARNLGQMVKRKSRELTNENIKQISQAYSNWKNKESYIDTIGFCRSVLLDEIRTNNYVLAPARYVSTVKQEINLDVALHEPRIPTELNNLKEKLVTNLNEIITAWGSKEKLVNINNILNAEIAANDLNNLTSKLYQSAIKNYFIDFNFSSNTKNTKSSKLPEGWSYKTFGELFTESKMNVESLGYCPKVYSVTNLGIQLREGKYTKELSKSTSKYKVAQRGDMVFGLSREIPNLDVFSDALGAFSPAYILYSPTDYRIGLLVGCVMRLKLMEQTDILKGGAREGKTLDKEKLQTKKFAIPSDNLLNKLWKK